MPCSATTPTPPGSIPPRPSGPPAAGNGNPNWSAPKNKPANPQFAHSGKPAIPRCLTPYKILLHMRQNIVRRTPTSPCAGNYGFYIFQCKLTPSVNGGACPDWHGGTTLTTFCRICDKRLSVWFQGNSFGIRSEAGLSKLGSCFSMGISPSHCGIPKGGPADIRRSP